jgi:predicted MPP superfamily phosphohydrolase
MRRRSGAFTFMIIAMLITIELLAYWGGCFLITGLHKTRFLPYFQIIYWAETAIILVLLLTIPRSLRNRINVKKTYQGFQKAGILMADLLPKLLFSAFVLISFLVQGIYIIINSLFIHSAYTRLDIESILIIGSILGVVLLSLIIRGILIGRFDFRVIKQTLHFENLPNAFNGLKIVQISDMHVGSFYNHQEEIQEAIDIINEQKPDLILFTGDMVNNTAEETKGWKELFLQLKSTLGNYSILGNHDYGDYVRWPSEEAKKQNLQELISFEKAAGFDILLNENRILEKNGEKIALIGVENWGTPPFAQYGYLPDAVKGTENMPFSILLSHDPSHWDEEVAGKTRIDLTLSGHTHGMQFGIIIGKWKWSPVQWRYDRWHGLYRHDKQCLYVNRGLGHIGFPGRVGMLPEITLIELKRPS